ncbi:MAG TPA: hypothetical protein DCR12_02635 [Lachnospiraceae bacterium]|nr:hypothetical protein [Lachnospiraceae bacterium]
MNERFSCIRLSLFPRWKEKIEDFENDMNPNLVDYLKNVAWEEDTEDWNAVYLVLDRLHDDDIVLYFALKCGMIGNSFSEDIYDLLEKNKDELLKLMPQDKQEAIAFLRDFMADAKEKDEINKVASTMSGVELTQFCINQNHREKCKKEQDDLTGIGAIIFYRYVLPIAKEIKQRAGCKFMYLFAADNTEDESLIKYYKDKLSFFTVSEFDASGLGERIVVPIMPFYDYRCEFMIRTI